MKKIIFSIGANNTTKKVETEKAISILARYYEGMGVTDVVGVWQGEKERSIRVEVITERANVTKVKKVCTELNTSLDQQAILVEIVDCNALFITERG